METCAESGKYCFRSSRQKGVLNALGRKGVHPGTCCNYIYENTGKGKSEQATRFQSHCHFDDVMGSARVSRQKTEFLS